eukprot:3038012-Pyramimonas_sp.AAC.1
MQKEAGKEGIARRREARKERRGIYRGGHGGSHEAGKRIRQPLGTTVLSASSSSSPQWAATRKERERGGWRLRGQDAKGGPWQQETLGRRLAERARDRPTLD